MTARLDDLKRMLPPPPLAIVDPPWSESSTQVGFDFPRDYQEFVASYGGGIIVTPRVSPDLEVAIPHLWQCSGSEAVGFVGFVERHLEDYEEFLEAEASSGLHEFPIGCFPSPGGLLSWGEASNSDMFFWSTVAVDPNEWKVVVFERHPGVFVTYEGGMVDFLVDLLGGRNHASGMMQGGSPSWVMHSDWAHSGLNVTAGSAADLE